MNQANKHGVSRRQLTEIYVKHFEGGALRTVANIAEKQYTFYGKLKKEFLQKFISNILFRTDTETAFAGISQGFY